MNYGAHCIWLYFCVGVDVNMLAETLCPFNVAALQALYESETILENYHKIWGRPIVKRIGIDCSGFSPEHLISIPSFVYRS